MSVQDPLEGCSLGIDAMDAEPGADWQAIARKAMDDLARLRQEASDMREELTRQRTLSARTDRLRSLGEMAAGVAHELNQPLSGVRGLAEHLLLAHERGWEVTPEALCQKLGLIVEQADRMSHIIDHVRTFAREAGRVVTRPTNMNRVVEAALGMLGSQLRARGIDPVLELEQDLPLVDANPFSLEEVLINLLTNARDAVEERLARDGAGVNCKVQVRTYLTRERDQRRVCLQVVDHGIGIETATLDHVFDPFYTTKGPDRGTGLGLAISQSIVEQFRGTIEAGSVAGAGTMMTVSMPVEGA
jgi:C4-dicarboxylate-specific signal transduction histidine kinase